MRVLTNTDAALRAMWHPVAESAELGDRPLAVRLMGEDWVLVPFAEGITAFPDRCPHRLAPLSAGRVIADRLQCGYHGWQFRADGSCALVPALGPNAPLPPRARLTPAAVTEHQGLIWLAPDPPRLAPPRWPEWDRADGRDAAFAPLPTQECEANAGLLCDNFLDEAHFPFVHASTIGSSTPEIIGAYEIGRDGWRVTARRQHRFRNVLDPEAVAGRRPLDQRRTMTYRIEPPFALSLLLDMPDAGTWISIRFCIQPVDARSCRIFSAIIGPEILAPDAALRLVGEEVAILLEDLAFQRHYRSQALPLDPTVEVHTRADRLTLEYRRLLADLIGADVDSAS